MLSKFITILILFFSLFILSCSDSTSNEELGKISGTLTFVGNWPTYGDIQVSAWTSWPPTGPPSAASIVLTSGVNPQEYSINGLSKGTYQVITAGWSNPTDRSSAVVLGVYWLETDSLGVDGSGMPTVTPVSIEISSDQLDWENIDIVADLDIVPTP